MLFGFVLLFIAQASALDAVIQHGFYSDNQCLEENLMMVDYALAPGLTACVWVAGAGYTKYTVSGQLGVQDGFGDPSCSGGGQDPLVFAWNSCEPEGAPNVWVKFSYSLADPSEFHVPDAPDGYPIEDNNPNCAGTVAHRRIRTPGVCDLKINLEYKCVPGTQTFYYTDCGVSTTPTEFEPQCQPSVLPHRYCINSTVPSPSPSPSAGAPSGAPSPSPSPPGPSPSPPGPSPSPAPSPSNVPSTGASSASPSATTPASDSPSDSPSQSPSASPSASPTDSSTSSSTPSVSGDGQTSDSLASCLFVSLLFAAGLVILAAGI